MGEEAGEEPPGSRWSWTRRARPASRSSWPREHARTGRRRGTAGLRPAALSLRPAGGGPGHAAERPVTAGPRATAGMVDCSIGTPCDPPPACGGRRRWPRRAPSGATRPRSGSPAYRRAAAGWIERRFGARRRPRAAVAACVGHQGVRGLDRPVPAPAHARTATPSSTRPSPIRPTPWAPLLAGCRAGAGARAGRRRARPRGDRRGRRGPGPAAVGQHAVQPDRAARPISARPRAGGGPGACRCSPTSATPSSPGTGRPGRILESGTDGVVAVHSLSKRSNLAGVRAGFYAGDPELVAYLLDVRRHAGLMVPGPVQAGAAWPSTTTPTWTSSGGATGSGWTSWPTCSAGSGLPARPAGRRLLPVGPGAARRSPTGGALAERLAADGRAPGQPRRALRRGRGRPRPGGRGPADGPARAGGRAAVAAGPIAGL